MLLNNFIRNQSTNEVGNTWNMGRVMAQSMGGGVSSELTGGSFEDGFKVALVTSVMAYAYSSVSSNYNTNNGEPHLGQSGPSNVGKIPTEFQLNAFNNGAEIPWTSDQSGFMKWLGKNVPYFDAFSEAHDGFHDIPDIPGNQVALAVTMPPSYALTITAAYNPYSYTYNMLNDINREYK